MNKLIVYQIWCWLIGLGLINSQAVAQAGQPVSLVAQVDKRVELMSILARLADYDEYKQDQYKTYVAAIERHFDPYKNHAAVAYMREVRARHSIGFDAVMGYAVQLGPAPGFQPLVPFKDQLPDKRWTVDAADRLAGLVRQFYADAHGEDFFTKQADRYRSAETRFADIIRQIDLPWFQRFYGKGPTQAFKLVIGLGNGGGNYGPHLSKPDGSQTSYAIMGTWSVDSLGLAQYQPASYLPVVIHEFNHSFVNPLIDQYAAELKPYADTIYTRVREPMRLQAYANSQTMLYEALVRASVIMYLQEHDSGDQSALGQLRDEQHRSFVWTDTLTGLLHRYAANRTRYPTLLAFMPEQVAFYRWLAPRMDSVLQAYARQRPQVVGIEPFGNNSGSVDAGTREILVRFTRPMQPDKYGIQLGEGGREHMPIQKVMGLTDDKCAFRMMVSLKPNQTYSFRLKPGGFRTEDGYLSEAYTVSFTTSP